MGFIVAIDGPAGAGKSTVARLVARRLGFALVDTGALYRCVALQAVRRGIDPDDVSRLGETARQLAIAFSSGEDGANLVSCDGEDVTHAIRSPDVSRMASVVAARPAVRGALLELQRRLGREVSHGAVLEGRDIGTVVFPGADAKVFLTASPEERARRRFDELAARGIAATYESVLSDQIERDRDDENRAVAPLKPAPDAVLVDTTGLPTEDVVLRIVAIVNGRRPAKRG